MVASLEKLILLLLIGQQSFSAMVRPIEYEKSIDMLTIAAESASTTFFVNSP
jgi:hypothetical protein